MNAKNMGHDDVINDIFDGPENFRKLYTDISGLLDGYGPKKDGCTYKILPRILSSK